MDDEEFQKCLEQIDADGSGTISFDEFAVWFIGGKEGASGLSDKLSGYLSSSSKYREDVMNLLELHHNKIKNQTLTGKDVRQASLKFNGGKCTEDNAGVSLGIKFGLTEDNDQIVKLPRGELGFIQKAKGHAHLTLKINSNTGESIE
jgi:hypothetical protein